MSICGQHLCPGAGVVVGVLKERDWIMGGLHGPTPDDVVDVTAQCGAGVHAARASLGARYLGVSTIENGARYLDNSASLALTARSSSAAQSYVQAEYFSAYVALIAGPGAYYAMTTSTSDQVGLPGGHVAPCSTVHGGIIGGIIAISNAMHVK